jgi:hypothetical protein
MEAQGFVAHSGGIRDMRQAFALSRFTYAG